MFFLLARAHLKYAETSKRVQTSVYIYILFFYLLKKLLVYIIKPYNILI